jgi:hypothetical protein
MRRLKFVAPESLAGTEEATGQLASMTLSTPGAGGSRSQPPARDEPSEPPVAPSLVCDSTLHTPRPSGSAYRKKSRLARDSADFDVTTLRTTIESRDRGTQVMRPYPSPALVGLEAELAEAKGQAATARKAQRPQAPVPGSRDPQCFARLVEYPRTFCAAMTLPTAKVSPLDLIRWVLSLFCTALSVISPYQRLA